MADQLRILEAGAAHPRGRLHAHEARLPQPCHRDICRLSQGRLKIRLARLGSILLLLLLALAAPRPATLVESRARSWNHLFFHGIEAAQSKRNKIVPDSSRDGRCGFAAMTVLLKSKNVAFNRDALMQFAVGCTDVIGRHTKLCHHLHRRHHSL